MHEDWMDHPENPLQLIIPVTHKNYWNITWNSHDWCAANLSEMPEEVTGMTKDYLVFEFANAEDMILFKVKWS